MIINVHAGHAPDGGIGCGAVGIGYESTMNRQVKEHLINLLRKAGHEVFDCTCEESVSSSSVLKKIVEKCNAHTVDLDISIHHNATAADKKDFDGDGHAKGSLCYVYSAQSSTANLAANIAKAIADRLEIPYLGLLDGHNLYFLRNTKAPAILIECCFVDDRDDMNAWNPYDVAVAIAHCIDVNIEGVSPAPNKEGPWYKVQVGAYKEKANAQKQLEILKRAGYDAFIQEY